MKIIKPDLPHKIAVLIPCLNEELTIRKLVEDFYGELPNAVVYVFDNNSDDGTVDEAKKAGAIVHTVKQRGKGNVVRSMFRRIDADIYIMIDGDGTYFPKDVHKLIEPVISGCADLVVGDRLSSSVYDKENTRPFHSFGNRLVRWIINKQYKSECKDILSGYRVFSRFFVCNFPVMSDGFEIETEITLHVLDKKLDIIEMPIDYKDRQEGSESKLNTFSDGYKIIKTIAFFFKNYRPLQFFGWLAVLIALIGFALGGIPVVEYMQTEKVTRLPLAVLAASLEILAMLMLSSGLILDTAVKQHRERLELRVMDYRRKNCRDDE